MCLLLFSYIFLDQMEKDLNNINMCILLLKTVITFCNFFHFAYVIFK